MRGAISIVLAALLAAAGLAALAPTTSAHVVSDTKAYQSHCDAFVFSCVLTEDDPTGGTLCEDGTCRFGGAVWNQGQSGEITALHDYDGSGLDVKAKIVDTVGQGDWGWLCVAQETSETDEEGNVCNDPKSEPDVHFCGTSPWLEETVKRPFEGGNFDDGETQDWVGVFLGGPVTQAWSNRPDTPVADEGIACSPLAGGATTGAVKLSVRE